ncbi:MULTISPECIES: RNA chaperone Hfq [Caloramator]|uniref:RNA-binding protein Hfq n=1 Tax=Caloramator australicus RC3 TaxID=857293 RepID=I7J4I7_9CLOT|nr:MULTISPECIES: RNA chaperone Hfq [Caloramator]MDO6355442.1 RNA chaperone Hfq [Caloramator sp. CAR-1]WDU84006.1 RNA chaperone Hfq [Caloramator sp. Dgby_cultured_2]CCJ32636.1 RNA-binding protein Hfq [Caloramator australicus RC3]
MVKNANNLQDVFLNGARKNKIPVTIFLVSGVQLKGNVKGFDSFTVILESEGKQMMVYKHAISTIVPAKPILYTTVNQEEKENKEV